MATESRSASQGTATSSGITARSSRTSIGDPPPPSTTRGAVTSDGEVSEEFENHVPHEPELRNTEDVQLMLGQDGLNLSLLVVNTVGIPYRESNSLMR